MLILYGTPTLFLKRSDCPLRQTLSWGFPEVLESLSTDVTEPQMAPVSEVFFSLALIIEFSSAAEILDFSTDW